MTQTKEIAFTKSGNAVGFTATGETVCGRYKSKTKVWHIWVDGGLGERLTDPRSRNFTSYAEARQYAATLVDDEATERLAWW